MLDQEFERRDTVLHDSSIDVYKRQLHTYVQSVYNFEICIENTIEHTCFPFFHSRLISYLQGIAYPDALAERSEYREDLCVPPMTP